MAVPLSAEGYIPIPEGRRAVRSEGLPGDEQCQQGSVPARAQLCSLSSQNASHAVAGCAQHSAAARPSLGSLPQHSQVLEGSCCCWAPAAELCQLELHF